MLKKITFTCHALPANYELPGGVSEFIKAMDGRPMEHVFLTSAEDDDWGCFGRGAPHMNDPCRRVIVEGDGIAQWARLINGDDPVHPTGITNFVDGTCHSVANRILALAGVDVSAASGNALVTFMYGKFGFGLEQYRELVIRSAEQINATETNAIPQDELERVLRRIGGNLANELSVLKNDFEEQCATDIDSLPQQQRLGLHEVYEAFQKRRSETHAGLDRTDPKAAQFQYFRLMAPEIVKSLSVLQDLFGRDQYFAIFKASPEQAVKLLLG